MSTPLTSEELIRQAASVASMQENNRIVSALYQATGNRAELFKGPVPDEDIVITSDNWTNLMVAIFGRLQ